MSYRLPPKPDRRAHIEETARQSLVRIDNGTITNLAIPCYRMRGRILTWLEVMVLDHFGWPAPRRPDQSFQPFPPPSEDEIDLTEEGYDTVEICFVDPPEGLTATGTIDGSIVRVSITSMCESAETEDVDVQFSIYISGESLRSVVTKGTIHIIAGPID